MVDIRMVPFEAVLAKPFPHASTLSVDRCDGELWTVDLEAAVGHELAWECQTAGVLAGQLPDAQVLEVAAGAERLIRWASALRTRMLGEFAHRYPAGSRAAPPGADPRAVTSVSRWLPDEVSMVLQVGREHARSLLGEAARLRQVLPATLVEWEAGRIDERTATAIAQTTLVLDDDTAARVEAEVLPKAVGGATYRSVRDRLRRTIARHDPGGARRRHERAWADRRMSISRGEDGMGSLWVSGSAAQTEASWQSVDRLARSLGSEDPRTLDQRRVDVTHQLLQGTLSVVDLAAVRAAVADAFVPGPAAVGGVVAAGADGAANAADTADTAGAASEVQVGVPGSAATEPVPAGTEPGSAVSGCAVSGGGGSGTGRCPGSGASIVSEVSVDALVGVVARVLAAKPDPDAVIGRKPLIQVVVGLDTLLGGDRPAELVGHGMIPAVAARALAAEGVWERLVTDPLSGVCRDHGRTRYRPPVGLSDEVKSRDGTCRGPVCAKPVRDLDHFVPWGADGVTDDENLHGLCQGHHKLKDAPGWQVISRPDGSLTWISPCGWSETTWPKDYREFTDPMPVPVTTPRGPEPWPALVPAPRAAPEAATAPVADPTGATGIDDVPPPF